MIHADQIRRNMPVMCSKNVQFALVDDLEGHNTIKLVKDDRGQHHYIPLSWVTAVDSKVHVNRPSDQVMREWSTSPPNVS